MGVPGGNGAVMRVPKSVRTGTHALAGPEDGAAMKQTRRVVNINWLPGFDEANSSAHKIEMIHAVSGVEPRLRVRVRVGMIRPPCGMLKGGRR